MARQLNRLSARTVATAKPGKYADGGGLWLQVTPTGAKSWVFRYERAGVEQYMGLGATHTVTLAQARQDAQAARMALRNGIDPQAQRKAARAAQAGVPTFDTAATAYIDEHRAGWSNPKHVAQWENTLATYASPFIGAKLVNVIDTDDVMSVLRPIWLEKNETASRVRGRIESVLDAAKVKGQRAGDNPARWRGHLDHLLAPPTKVRTVKHFDALPYADAPAFVRDLQKEVGTAARALEFLIYCAARPGMVAGADPAERHGDAWHVPGPRMKNRKPFRVPLPRQAVTLLDSLPRERGAGIFPGLRGPHLSSGAMDALLERMGYAGKATAHGFRSTFRDWAAETTTFPREIAEAALAHTLKDKTEAAYQRGDLFDKRRELMQAWADYLTQT